MIIKYRDNLEGLIHKKPDNFLILYPSKYSNLENKEIPIEDIGVYYNPYYIFRLEEFSVELLEMKNKPKKASIFKQADILLRISGSSLNSFKKDLIESIIALLIFGFFSIIIFLFSEDITFSLIPLLIYFLIMIHAFHKSVIKPLKNKDKIIEEASGINFIHYLKETYFN